MKKRISILKKGIDKKAGPTGFCCYAGFLPLRS